MKHSLFGLCLLSLGCVGAPADPVKGYEAVWRANCDAVVECVETSPEEDWDWIQQRADECAVAGATDEAWGTALRDAVEAGRIVYDQDMATQCLKFYRKIDCIFMWDEKVSDTCAEYLAGQVECAAECSINEECTSGVCRGNLCDCSE